MRTLNTFKFLNYLILSKINKKIEHKCSKVSCMKTANLVPGEYKNEMAWNDIIDSLRKSNCLAEYCFHNHLLATFPLSDGKKIGNLLHSLLYHYSQLPNAGDRQYQVEKSKKNCFGSLKSHSLTHQFLALPPSGSILQSTAYGPAEQ